jgi:hypothetical protein
MGRVACAAVTLGAYVQVHWAAVPVTLGFVASAWADLDAAFYEAVAADVVGHRTRRSKRTLAKEIRVRLGLTLADGDEKDKVTNWLSSSLPHRPPHLPGQFDRRTILETIQLVLDQWAETDRVGDDDPRPVRDYVACFLGPPVQEEPRPGPGQHGSGVLQAFTAPPMPHGLSVDGPAFTLRFGARGEEWDAAELARFALATNERRLVLVGRAGAGKSVAAARALLDISRSVPAYFIGQTNWIRHTSDRLMALDLDAHPDAWRAGLDVLLSCATSDVTVDEIEAFGAHGQVLLLFDGVNLGPAPVAQRVVNVLHEALRRLRSAVVILTDRSDIRYPDGGGWVVARAMDLDLEFAREQIEAQFGVEAWGRMPVAARGLLRSPFFLNLALGGTGSFSHSRSASLRHFISDRASIDDTAVQEVVRATASAYAIESRGVHANELSPTTLTSLTESGIAAPDAADQAVLRFNDSLVGDYFASLHLVEQASSLDATELDAITFSGDRWKFDGLSADTESFDAITLAAEQLPTPATGDPFLRAVYDWNWRAAVACLGVTNPADGPFSTAARVVVLALLSERRVDRVDGTRRRASRLLEALPDPLAQELVAAPEDSGRDIIAKCVSEADWFGRWQALFCREDLRMWTDDELDAIHDADTLLGWTVSYVLKRAPISEAASQRLQGGYRGLKVAANATSTLHASIRWRIVHALGAGASEDVLDFLLSALDDDPYPWVRWGAARSVAEFAARATAPDVTHRAIEHLSQRAPVLPASVQKEVAWASQHHGGAPHFPSMMRPLLETFRREASGDVARASCDEWLARFDQFWGFSESEESE